MNEYLCVYMGRRKTVHADDAQAAQREAGRRWKVRVARTHAISVYFIRELEAAVADRAN